MNAVTEMPSPLVFTDNAAKKVQELINEEGTPDPNATSTCGCGSSFSA